MSDIRNDEKAPIFDSLDTEERLMIKKVILSDKETLKGITFKSVDFSTAILRGEPMTIAVPPNIVEKLKDNYSARIGEPPVSNDEQSNSCEVETARDSDD